jgi:hypothetical protein
VNGVSEAVVLEFRDPAGEALRFEWRADDLASLDPQSEPGQPVWRLGGELDWDEIEAVRVVSARIDDGRLLAIAAVRPAGAEGHGEEVTAGAIGDGESFEQLHEALLSTEYGPDGRPRRIGLELYPAEDSIPIRVAGEAQAIETADNGAVSRLTAALRLRAGGAAGAGSLDVLRPS